MDYINKINTIKQTFTKMNHQEIVDEIINLQLSGGTQGEVLISVCSYLIKLKKNEPDVFNSVSKETNELIKYSNSIGLFPV